jgi:hypothetical protein
MTEFERGADGCDINRDRSLCHPPTLPHETRWPELLKFRNDFLREGGSAAAYCPEWGIKDHFLWGDAVEESLHDRRDDEEDGDFVSGEGLVEMVR